MIKLDLKDATNSCRSLTPPPVSMGVQNLPISVPPISVRSAPWGFLQNNETCSGSTSAMGIRLVIYLDDLG